MERIKHPSINLSRRPKDISVVIRARNEVDNLGHVLELIQDQTIQPQVIVVDNASNDGTRQLAVAHGATIIDIPTA
jgi:glycosyltransferase involved in cell wall biosynthesis